MDSENEKRRHQRLPLRFSVLCQRVGVPVGKVFTGTSVDVSQGGMLINFNTKAIKQGELLSVEMSIPPTKGLLEYGGRFSSYARVVRIDRSYPKKMANSNAGQTLALEFCESPKLQV